MKKKILVLLMILIIINLFAEVKGFLRYGDDFSYTFLLDDKWKMDLDYAEEVGINNFLFIKEKKKSKYPDAILMFNLLYKNETMKTLSDCIEYDLNNFKNNFPGFIIDEIIWEIKNEENYDFKIYYIYSENDTIKQYIGFIEGTHPYIVSVVLQLDAYSINKNDKYINDFKNIIKSFKNMPYFKMEE